MKMKEYFNSIANTRIKKKRRNSYYYKLLVKYLKFIIPENSRVIEIGCGTGELLAALNPSKGMGIDYSEKMIKIAKKNFPHLNYDVADAEEFKTEEKYDFIVMSDLLNTLDDIQKMFSNLAGIVLPQTRIIITNYNYLWEPFLKFGELIGMKEKQPNANWLSARDIENILEIEGFQTIKIQRKILMPKYIPLLSWFFNVILVNLPLLRKLSLVNILIVRKTQAARCEKSVSIIIPTKNEKGNIEKAIERIPVFGVRQEIIFVEGGSQDGTQEEICRVRDKYPGKNIVSLVQKGMGKGDAVREAFAAASGEVLMILDGDLTVPPEELVKFYDALVNGKAEFINGCRLVYPMEKQAMRFLNLIANKFFGMMFSFLLDQPFKDTLCGTKVLLKKDYLTIEKGRSYFGNFDPFGDFDLLFGASKINLKIREVPVRYRERSYGKTQIKRFTHGWLLIKMCLFAARKIKFM